MANMRPFLSCLMLLAATASAQLPPAPPQMRTITVGYENRKEQFTVGKKTKWRRVSVPVTITVAELPGKVLAVQRSSYYAGTNTQYNYVSPACLNSFWCHLLAGDPGATSQAVYQPYTLLVIQGADFTYGATSTELSSGRFTASSEVTYGLLGGTLYLFDGGTAYPLSISAQVANPR